MKYALPVIALIVIIIAGCTDQALTETGGRASGASQAGTAEVADWPVNEKETGPVEFSKEYLKPKTIDEYEKEDRLFLGCDRDYYLMTIAFSS